MMVTTSMDKVVETRWMCGNCSLSMNGRVLQIDLICLPFKKIYVVLGMDWISNNSMYIGCQEKVIYISTKETTLNGGITTLLEGTVSMTNLLFEQKKYILLILTKESGE